MAATVNNADTRNLKWLAGASETTYSTPPSSPQGNTPTDDGTA